MLSQLKTGHIMVGAKQSAKAVKENEVRMAFAAENADPMITGPFIDLCAERGVMVERVPTMEELGAACGIEVGAAIAVLLK